MDLINNAIEIRNRNSITSRTGIGIPGPQGPAGQDLTGPLNIDGGKPQSFYAGLASVDAGYYNETYGGILYGLDGGKP